MIQVKDLTKKYGSTVAVDQLSFSVEKGTIFGLLGENGAGKSTTLECILGTRKPEGGIIELFGEKLVKGNRTLFEKIGVQFQDAHFQEQIKVEELCQMTSSLYKKPIDYQKLLMEFDLIEKKNAFVKELSGGQRQRLFIILALIPNPELVFLDELTTGLDARARREVWKILEQLKKEGLTIVITSHFMDEVEVLCDKICILQKGKSVFYGTVLEAKEKSKCDRLEDAYLFFTEKEEYIHECI